MLCYRESIAKKTKIGYVIKQEARSVKCGGNDSPEQHNTDITLNKPAVGPFISTSLEHLENGLSPSIHYHILTHVLSRTVLTSPCSRQYLCVYR